MAKKIFISYSDQDRSKMRSLEKVINKSSHFKPVIIADRREAFIALTDKVKTGIFESDYFIPILTKTSISTQWVNQEIGFAVAQNKTIIPLIDKEIIDLLKGFIHKNMDLPYSFSDKKVNPKSTRNIYRKACTLLINDLLVKNNHSVSTLELENVFPGVWKSEFTAPDFKAKELEIEIKDGNRYFTKGEHWFNIEKFKISQDKKHITFVKVGLGKDKRRFVNDLKVLKLGQVYSGFEREENEDDEIIITYSRAK